MSNKSIAGIRQLRLPTELIEVICPVGGRSHDIYPPLSSAFDTEL